MTDNIKLPPMPEWAKMDNLNGMVPSEIRTALNEFGREAVRLNAQAVPDGWALVPVEPTPEMLAAGAVSVLPQASNDIELARSAAMIVLCKPDAPSCVPMELLAATIATMAPYYRAMLSAAPAAPQPAQQADKLVMCGYGDGGYACCEGGPCAAELHNNSVLQPAQQPLTDEKDALLRQALDALEGFANITNDSQGVKGYHLNGDIAEWDEFDEVDAASSTIEAIRTHLGVKND